MSSTVLADLGTRTAILEELKAVIVESQQAVLAGQLRQFEDCLLRQTKLCCKLESAVNGGDFSTTERAGIAASALETRKQNRLFFSLLRRLQKNLEIERNTLHGSSPQYSPAGRDYCVGRVR